MHALLPTPQEWSILALSLRVSLLSMIVMTIPAVACAWLLARKQFRGKTLFDALIHLPLVLPPVVTGYLLLIALGRRGIIGRWLHDWFNFDTAFTWKAAVIAAAVMGFPLMVRSTRLAIELVDRRLEQAAATLGSRPWRVFATITLPLAMPGVITGLILGFARSLGEFGATITFAGNIAGQSRTLPVAVYTSMQMPGQDAAAARLVIIAIILSFGALLASEIVSRRMNAKVDLK